jgi:hypothetical protein
LNFKKTLIFRPKHKNLACFWRNFMSDVDKNVV